MGSVGENFFGGCIFLVLPDGLFKKRMNIISTQITKHGGVVKPNFSEDVTHVIVEDCVLDGGTFENLLKLYKITAETVGNCIIVPVRWLSSCLKEKKLMPVEGYEYRFPNVNRACDKLNDQHRAEISEDVLPCSSSGKLQKERSPVSEPPVKIQKIGTAPLVSKVNEEHPQRQSFNDLIIEELEKIKNAYHARGDQWRDIGYRKAISAIKKYNKPICNAEDVRLIPNLTKKMEDRVLEIIETGHLEKTKNIRDDKTECLELFMNLWGVGQTTAQAWYHQGFRSLEDVEKKANLTKSQVIGLRYYSEIMERTPREEVEEIVQYVKGATCDIDSVLEVIPCGSYRRGRQMCGDVDILVITKIDNSVDVLSEIMAKLASSGFIVDWLVGDESSKKPKKFLGLCKLPREDSKVRRLDIFMAPEDEWATAVMHYTGSDLLNRSIRQRAINMGMRLTDHGLYLCEKGQQESEGQKLQTPTEESIFKYLKLEYRPPEERETL